ncbi:hypothetical protein SLEP1_g28700 [Rubroshorea leprosula]|uniref:Uncharacterized protein n=1 Tax=Rubroshorea leprosula TaxID=152421 RepID=A0AAV5K3V4_9ROSI|nr:hypothetical protein SLEP1_g28700 [Rubroshorea leprosula]
MPWKTGEKAWFLAFFSCSRTRLEPRNSPPAGKSGSALLCPPATLVVGAKFFKFCL